MKLQNFADDESISVDGLDFTCIDGKLHGTITVQLGQLTRVSGTDDEAAPESLVVKFTLRKDHNNL